MSHISNPPPYSPSIFQLGALIFVVSSLTQLFWYGVAAALAQLLG